MERLTRWLDRSKAVLAAALCAALITDSVQAAPVVATGPFSLALPSHAGSITQSFVPAGRSTGVPDIVIVQDLHANRSVQFAISSVLKHLKAAHWLPKQIAVEGATGPIEVSQMQHAADAARRRAADYLVSQAEMPGDMHFVVTEGEGELYGVENAETYDAIVDLYQKSYSQRRALLARFDRLERAVRRLERSKDATVAANARTLDSDLTPLRELAQQQVPGDELLPTLHKALRAVEHLQVALPKDQAEEMLPPLSAALNFYTMALMRDEELVANMLDLRKARNQSTSVLVVGGFHTPGITELLKKQNLSYVVITPDIKSHTHVDEQLYVERMLGYHLTPDQIEDGRDWASMLVRQRFLNATRQLAGFNAAIRHKVRIAALLGYSLLPLAAQQTTHEVPNPEQSKTEVAQVENDESAYSKWARMEINALPPGPDHDLYDAIRQFERERDQTRLNDHVRGIIEQVRLGAKNRDLLETAIRSMFNMVAYGKMPLEENYAFRALLNGIRPVDSEAAARFEPLLRSMTAVAVSDLDRALGMAITLEGSTWFSSTRDRKELWEQRGRLLLVWNAVAPSELKQYAASKAATDLQSAYDTAEQQAQRKALWIAAAPALILIVSAIFLFRLWGLRRNAAASDSSQKKSETRKPGQAGIALVEMSTVAGLLGIAGMAVIGSISYLTAGLAVATVLGIGGIIAALNKPKTSTGNRRAVALATSLIVIGTALPADAQTAGKAEKKPANTVKTEKVEKQVLINTTLRNAIFDIELAARRVATDPRDPKAKADLEKAKQAVAGMLQLPNGKRDLDVLMKQPEFKEGTGLAFTELRGMGVDLGPLTEAEKAATKIAADRAAVPPTVSSGKGNSTSNVQQQLVVTVKVTRVVDPNAREIAEKLQESLLDAIAQLETRMSVPGSEKEKRVPENEVAAEGSVQDAERRISQLTANDPDARYQLSRIVSDKQVTGQLKSAAFLNNLLSAPQEDHKMMLVMRIVDHGIENAFNTLVNRRPQEADYKTALQQLAARVEEFQTLKNSDAVLKERFEEFLAKRDIQKALAAGLASSDKSIAEKSAIVLTATPIENIDPSTIGKATTLLTGHARIGQTYVRRDPFAVRMANDAVSSPVSSARFHSAMSSLLGLEDDQRDNHPEKRSPLMFLPTVPGFQGKLQEAMASNDKKSQLLAARVVFTQLWPATHPLRERAEEILYSTENLKQELVFQAKAYLSSNQAKSPVQAARASARMRNIVDYHKNGSQALDEALADTQTPKEIIQLLQELFDRKPLIAKIEKVEQKKPAQQPRKTIVKKGGENKPKPEAAPAPAPMTAEQKKLEELGSMLAGLEILAKNGDMAAKNEIQSVQDQVKGVVKTKAGLEGFRQIVTTAEPTNKIRRALEGAVSTADLAIPVTVQQFEERLRDFGEKYMAHSLILLSGSTGKRVETAKAEASRLGAEIRKLMVYKEAQEAMKKIQADTSADKGLKNALQLAQIDPADTAKVNAFIEEWAKKQSEAGRGPAKVAPQEKKKGSDNSTKVKAIGFLAFFTAVGASVLNAAQPAAESSGKVMPTIAKATVEAPTQDFAFISVPEVSMVVVLLAALVLVVVVLRNDRGDKRQSARDAHEMETNLSSPDALTPQPHLTAAQVLADKAEGFVENVSLWLKLRRRTYAVMQKAVEYAA